MRQFTLKKEKNHSDSIFLLHSGSLNSKYREKPLRLRSDSVFLDGRVRNPEGKKAKFLDFCILNFIDKMFYRILYLLRVIFLFSR